MKNENLIKAILAETDERDRQISRTIEEVYEVCQKYSLNYSTKEDPFAEFHVRMEEAKKKIKNASSVTVNDISCTCERIYDAVEEGIQNYVFIDFGRKLHRSMGRNLDICRCIIKIVDFDTCTPYYIFADECTSFNSMVWLGEDTMAYLVTDFGQDDYRCLRLSEFHLLSYNNLENKETGIFTSFSYMTSKICTSMLQSYSLDPIKNLILSEWITELKKEKDDVLYTIGQKDLLNENNKENIL